MTRPAHALARSAPEDRRRDRACSRAPSRRMCPAADPSSGRPAQTGCEVPRKQHRPSRAAAAIDLDAGRAEALRSSVAAAAPISCGDGSFRRASGRRSRRSVGSRFPRRPSTEHVAVPIGPRQPHVLADRQGHVSARAVDFIGQLHAGGGRADDQHATVGQCCGLR